MMAIKAKPTTQRMGCSNKGAKEMAAKTAQTVMSNTPKKRKHRGKRNEDKVKGLRAKHEYRRERFGPYDYEESDHLHYLTSGLNLTAGFQYRLFPDIGIEVGYQSFYETLYFGVAFPF